MSKVAKSKSKPVTKSGTSFPRSADSSHSSLTSFYPSTQTDRTCHIPSIPPTADLAAPASSLPTARPNERKKLSKSRNGCITCKARRLKCDEGRPTCQRCSDRNVVCGGYKKDFKWRSFGEDSFEPRKTKSGGSGVDGGSTEVTAASIIASPSEQSSCVEVSSASGDQLFDIDSKHVFTVAPSSTGSTTTADVATTLNCNQNDGAFFESFPPFPAPFSLQRNLHGIQLATGSAELLALRFDRHTCSILSLMDGPMENPWRTVVWPFALTCPSLYHSILSMTAFHWSVFEPRLRVEGIEHLRKSLGYLRRDLGQMRTELSIMTMLALAFGESWDSPIRSGKQHIRAAGILIDRAVRELQLWEQAGNENGISAGKGAGNGTERLLSSSETALVHSTGGGISSVNSMNSSLMGMPPPHSSGSNSHHAIPPSGDTRQSYRSRLRFLCATWLYLRTVCGASVLGATESEGCPEGAKPDFDSFDICRSSSTFSGSSSSSSCLSPSSSTSLNAEIDHAVHLLRHQTGPAASEMIEAPLPRTQQGAKNVNANNYQTFSPSALIEMNKPSLSPDPFRLLSIVSPEEGGLDPLMGCAFTLFPLIDQVSTLARQARSVILQNCDGFRPGRSSTSAFLFSRQTRTGASGLNSTRTGTKPTYSVATMISKARIISRALWNWTAPVNLPERKDPACQVSHSIDTAEAYRYAALLFLYQAFPFLGNELDERMVGEKVAEGQAKKGSETENESGGVDGDCDINMGVDGDERDHFRAAFVADRSDNLNFPLGASESAPAPAEKGVSSANIISQSFPFFAAFPHSPWTGSMASAVSECSSNSSGGIPAPSLPTTMGAHPSTFIPKSTSIPTTVTTATVVPPQLAHPLGNGAASVATSLQRSFGSTSAPVSASPSLCSFSSNSYHYSSYPSSSSVSPPLSCPDPMIAPPPDTSAPVSTSYQHADQFGASFAPELRSSTVSSAGSFQHRLPAQAHPHDGQCNLLGGAVLPMSADVDTGANTFVPTSRFVSESERIATMGPTPLPPQLLSTETEPQQQHNRFSSHRILTASIPPPTGPTKRTHYTLAHLALRHLSSIPPSSSTLIVHIFPLLLAGPEAVDQSVRHWVEQRWLAMHSRLALGLLEKCKEVTKEVWTRREAFVRLGVVRKMGGDDGGAGPDGTARRSQECHNEGIQNNWDVGEKKAEAGNGRVGTDPGRSLHFNCPSDSIPRLDPGFESDSTLHGSTPASSSPSPPPSALPHLARSGALDDLLEFSVGGKMHWLGVMHDWKWEILLG